MVIKHILFLGLALLIGGTFTPAQAELYICQKGRCDYTPEDASIRPWLHKLYAFFKTPDARIDFCEANPKIHSCLTDGLKWTAQSPAATVNFAIPVARTLPQKNTLLMDYLVTANAFMPSCSFSTTTFEEAENKTVRMVSRAFECQMTGISKIKLQNTFFIDFIDFDNSVIGAQYTIQTHGELGGNSAGYTLMKFRDGNTLLPLVPQPYYGEMPDAPDAYQAKKMADTLNTPPITEEPSAFDGFVGGVKDWWTKLKESFNLDKPKRRSSHEEPSWWNKFSDTFMKVIYLEPLE
ncbi:MAG: hypothetical protein II938_03280 [Alphaproteobacteria bacterium]|nr:hypothetical protein [Alphaproteobacteria bacterium]